MVKEINGNLIQLGLIGEFDLIAHGCNTQKQMIEGIGIEIATNFPEAVETDNLYVTPKMGLLSYAETTIIGPSGNNLIIANMYTQINLGRYSRDSTSGDTYKERLNAIALCFLRLVNDYPTSKVGIPRIGSDVSGIKWGDVRSVLNKVIPKSFDLTIIN